jgi:transcriptional regulator with XRE-family HTH domain
VDASARGQRIARARRRRGLSQAALAGLAGRSESWLSQVERGLRRVDSRPPGRTTVRKQPSRAASDRR